MSDLDLKVLCVDDEPEILEVYSQTIKAAGLTPILCQNSVDAERAFFEEFSDLVLVISDLQMGEKSGFEFRSSILPDATAVPFVIVSGHITKEMALEAIDLKIDAFYNKPIDESEIKTALEKYAKPRIAAIRESQELLAVFIEEVGGILEDMENALIVIENERSNIEQLNLVYRCAHTIKGSSGVLPTNLLTRYLHRFEDIISAIKKGQTEFTDQVYEILMRGYDRIKELIEAAAAKKIRNYQLDDLLPELDLSASDTPPKGPAVQQQTGQPKTSAQKPKETIPVPIEILEKLSSCSGEITVIRNMVNKLVSTISRQNPGNKDVGNLGELLDEMYKVNSSVQTYVTDMRKVSISNVLKPLPRLVRDLCRGLGKSIELKIDGEKLRIDNALATVLSNSLVHLVRNSADHGVEDTETRKQRGKSESGHISISCREIGEEVHVVISDDGRGIDPEKIGKKAVEKGLFSADQLTEMDQKQILAVIFMSGFSTASSVSDISGRGVGMDMVKSSVEAVGGSITIDSVVGSGSTFTIKLPVPKSVLIIKSLIVECAGVAFAVPQDNIQRVLRIDHNISDAVQMASLGSTLRLGSRILPLVRLRDVLAVESPKLSNHDEDKGRSTDVLNALILDSESVEYALQVDGIQDAEEIVVKRIDTYSNSKNAFLGATFMGDGNIGLILDAAGIARLANIDKTSVAKPAIEQPVDAENAQTELDNSNNLLLFKLKSRALFGVPLAQVFRLEELDPVKIQHSGGERVIIYRDSVMPLLAFDRLLNLHDDPGFNATRQPKQNGKISTIVTQSVDGFLGLEVESVVDIEQSIGEISSEIRDRKGVVGNTFIRDHIITLVDLEKVLEKQIQAHGAGKGGSSP